jgi:rhodanese-related sulfurtransferase
MRRLLALSIVSVLTACGGSSAASTTTAETTESTGSEAPRFAQISVQDVSARITSTEAPIAVFDANSPATFAEHHVPGATWVDYDAVAAESLPTDHATALVFYCGNEQCHASHVAANTAIDLGFTDVSVMGAGIDGWVAAGQPVETAPSAEATATQ